MSITLEITPQAQAELARQAAIKGRGLEMYAASLLEEALHRSFASSSLTGKATFGASLVDAFAEARDLFAEGELEISRDVSPGRAVELS